MTDIEWGYNCLTQGVHHGRPEALWNLPLLQVAQMYTDVEIIDFVVSRIYLDAIQFVNHGVEPRMPKEWADRVKEIAEEKFAEVYDRKLEEIRRYYGSSEHHRDVEMVIERFKAGKLNEHYKPVHGHDSLNMLCRILGTMASRAAS